MLEATTRTQVSPRFPLFYPNFSTSTARSYILYSVGPCYSHYSLLKLIGKVGTFTFSIRCCFILFDKCTNDSVYWHDLQR